MERPAGSGIQAAVFAVLTLIWGTTWAAIRIGLSGIPPMTGVSLRFAIAAAVLFLAAVPMGVRFGRSARERWLWIVNGLLSYVVSYGVVYWCEQWIPSGLAAVLFSTFTLFVALMAHVALPGERLGTMAAVGVLIGFVGIAVIYSEDLTALGGAPVRRAALIMLLSPLAAAIANVAVKRWGHGVHPLSLAAVPMGIGAGVMGALAIVAERGRPVVFDAVSVGALLYLAVFGSAVTFTLYYWLLAKMPASRLAMIAYLTPLTALGFGAAFLGEPLQTRTLVGTPLVLAGIMLASRQRS
ncbi:MAG: DMT family transporter [Acidobacteriota bacterium]|nr:MAG: DMT family transporter [Acidobacteriota bacterium]